MVNVRRWTVVLVKKYRPLVKVTNSQGIYDARLTGSGTMYGVAVILDKTAKPLGRLQFSWLRVVESLNKDEPIPFFSL